MLVAVFFFINEFLRRMKSDVLGQLPSKRRTMIVLDPSLVKLNKVLEKSHSQLQTSKVCVTVELTFDTSSLFLSMSWFPDIVRVVF
jgi:16S rRNA C1402 (ribose-2'-O) methylase RsmI